MAKNWVRTILLVILSVLLMGLMLPGCVSWSQTANKIIIRYSSTTTDEIGGVYAQFQKPGSGYTYLVVNLDIENQGYDSFWTSPICFSVVVNNVEYGWTPVFALENELETTRLLDGGRITGAVAFKVPTEVSTMGYEIRATSMYKDCGTYNIEWIKQ